MQLIIILILMGVVVALLGYATVARHDAQIAESYQERAERHGASLEKLLASRDQDLHELRNTIRKQRQLIKRLYGQPENQPQIDAAGNFKNLYRN